MSRMSTTRSRRLGVLGLCLLLLAACTHEAGSPAPPGSSLPNLAVRPDGALVMSWVEPAGAGHALAFAVLEAGGWSEPRTVASGSDWFVNWADVPSVVPLEDGLWAAHWLVKRAGGPYAYDVALALSTDGGRRWGAPLQPHLDGTPTEHGFVSVWPERTDDGAPAAGIAWLDGRYMVRDVASTAAHDPRTSLRAAVYTADGQAISHSEVDDRVCDCCRTAVAVTPGGPLIAYRNRTEEEVRDILLAGPGSGRAPAARAAWQRSEALATDGWTIGGCPVNGPALASRGDAVAAAWYTQAGGAPRVRFARRTGAGAPWSAPLDVADSTLGRVDVALLEDGEAAVSWMSQSGDDQADILLARIDARGRRGEPVRVARTRAARPAGFPRLARQGERLLVAWTRWTGEADEAQSRVEVSSLAIADLPGAR